MSEALILPTFEELIQSDLFTFHVGRHGYSKVFKVHSKAITATSPYFRALVDSGMTESRTKSVEYSDVEPDDFARFVEYAYRHDYTVPRWVIDESYEEDESPSEVPAMAEEPLPEPVSEPEPVPEPEEEDNQPLFSKKSKRKRSKPIRSLSVKFEERNYLDSNQSKKVMLAGFEPQQNNAPDQDFTRVLLAHARLCSFARMRLVEPLRKLTLHKLHQTLLGFSLYEQRVSDIVELARYAYKQDGHELRQLVVDYMVTNVSTFGKHPSFRLFLQEGGEFVEDFWDCLYNEHIMK